MPRFLIQATLSGSKRSIVFGFIVGIGITVALPYPAFGARSSGGSRRSKAASVHRSFVAAPSFVSSGRFSVGVAHGASVRFRDFRRHRQDFVSHPFHSFGFSGVAGVSEEPVILIHVFHPAPAVEPGRPATNRIYVQPRWVDGGHGVEVLQPGYWTDSKQPAKR